MQIAGKIAFHALYDDCRLCPRQCGVNRQARGEKRGFCGEDDRVRVAFIGAHFGEEPPLTGTNGSGTIFFSGCSLQCTFCQNHQISRDSFGEYVDMASLQSRVVEMIRSERVHNINFVTPDHFFPHVFALISSLRKRGYELPMVFNLSGYQSRESIEKARDYADIYLPDFKYGDRTLAASLSRARDYPEVSLKALAEMVRQKGFLDTCTKNVPLATTGVLVRHLILPGQVENSISALTILFIEFGPELPLSLMSQYHPVGASLPPFLRRTLRKEEFDSVYAHARDLGFRNLFVQFPEPDHADLPSAFLPDFRKAKPFEKSDHNTMHSLVDRSKTVC
jgi:putative pyruvate formate lyase activating enzyme